MNIIEKLSVVSSLLATFAVPAVAGVVVNSPVNNSEVTSPFTLSAVAATCSAQNVAAIGYSFDDSADSTIIDGASIDRAIGSSSGPHTLHVKAWGNGGAVCVLDVAINVKGGTTSAPGTIPPDAISVSNIQALSHWNAQHDTGGSGSASGSTRLVSSPSLHGTTREFQSSYRHGGDERFSVTYADDTSAMNFFYDAWVYFPAGADVANLEMDTNQAIGGGKVVIYGVQCDGYAGTWDFTENIGGSKKGRPHWKPVPGTKCDPRTWSRNVWHHVQISYSRNSSGEITYHSAWLDGVEDKLNTTVNGLFHLGWAPLINTQFQLDGFGSSGSTKAYLDSLTISRW